MKKNLVHLIFIIMSLIAVMPAISVQAESVTNSESIPTSTNTINKHKSPDTSREIVTTDHINRKKVLIEESREMSPFFKLGIAINIIMVLTFGWWFSKEWRRKK
ncbi:MAG: hypothetical protein OEW99_00040 [Gammaproteobacteria bacterium]|nr:hypothetical protein [Gammaproteobacteria bacterium]